MSAFLRASLLNLETCPLGGMLESVSLCHSSWSLSRSFMAVFFSTSFETSRIGTNLASKFFCLESFLAFVAVFGLISHCNLLICLSQGNKMVLFSLTITPFMTNLDNKSVSALGQSSSQCKYQCCFTSTFSWH